MKVWSIIFDGIYPVGSAAIVITDNDGVEASAVALFLAEWRKKYPGIDPGETYAVPLNTQVGVVHILEDGNY